MTIIQTGKSMIGNQKGHNPLCRIMLFFCLVLIPSAAPAQTQASSPLPVIARLDSRDTMFRQFLSDVEAARRVLFSPRLNRDDPSVAQALASSLTIYSYTAGENDSLLGISARCNIPYGTLASLNRFSHAEDIAEAAGILLPSMPGIFVPETPGSDLERLLFSSRNNAAVVLTIPREGRAEKFLFVPGDDFTPTERIFFLNPGFHFPLKHFQISSSYGPRVNPVTGKAGNHGGVDLAAPEGTEVYAVKSGIVMGLGEDPILGKYIILSHENEMASFYGHLSSIDANTTLNAEIKAGSLIGKVGTTGQSTGPHLHFEIRQNGQTRDPVRLLRLFKGQA